MFKITYRLSAFLLFCVFPSAVSADMRCPIKATNPITGKVVKTYEGCPHVHQNPGKSFSEEAWGEAGRAGYSVAADVMDARHSGLGPLSRDLKCALRPIVGDLVDIVRVRWSARMMNKWKAAGFEIELGGVEAGAQTYGYNIYILSSESEARANLGYTLNTLLHEIYHTIQFVESGGSLGNFGYQYFKNYKKADLTYEKNIMELEAVRYASRNLPKAVAQYKKCKQLSQITGRTFLKTGNNGTVSCNTFCGFSKWGGQTGSCVSANLYSGPSVACDAVTHKDTKCTCTANTFEKTGNNGTVSCSQYCAGAQWGRVGSCVAALDTKTGAPGSCGWVRGYDPKMVLCACSK